MEFFKAVPLGGILTYVVAVLIGSQGRSGGQLNIFHVDVQVDVYQAELWWSWPLFFAGTGLAWGLMVMQR